MPRAVWNGAVIAESDDTIVVEGNHYFPAEAVNAELIRESTRHTVCAWKGVASYYDVVVGDDRNPSAGWYYPDPSAAIPQIAGRVAFWNGVLVEE